MTRAIIIILIYSLFVLNVCGCGFSSPSKDVVKEFIKAANNANFKKMKNLSCKSNGPFLNMDDVENLNLNNLGYIEEIIREEKTKYFSEKFKLVVANVKIHKKLQYVSFILHKTKKGWKILVSDDILKEYPIKDYVLLSSVLKYYVTNNINTDDILNYAKEIKIRFLKDKSLMRMLSKAYYRNNDIIKAYNCLRLCASDKDNIDFAENLWRDILYNLPQPELKVDTKPNKEKIITHNQKITIIYSSEQEYNLASISPKERSYVKNYNEQKNIYKVIISLMPGSNNISSSFSKYKYQLPYTSVNKTVIFDKFKDNKDGTFTDRTSNLMWSTQPIYKEDWSGIHEKLKNYTYAGYSDWRLPTKQELKTLIIEDQLTGYFNAAKHYHTLDQLFTNKEFFIFPNKKSPSDSYIRLEIHSNGRAEFVPTALKSSTSDAILVRKFIE